MKQGTLFETSRWPEGLLYQAEFLSPDEEVELLGRIRELPLEEAKYKEYRAKRRIVSFGAGYDFTSNELLPAGPIPEFLHPLRERIGNWIGVAPTRFSHALVAEYAGGTQLGWHRDVFEFEIIIGVSLAGSCLLRLRPYPPVKGKASKALSLELEPRSVYCMRGEVRWEWQHSIPPTKMTRYSITFRTRSKRGTRRVVDEL